MSLVQYLQAWFSTQDAEDWLKFTNPDGEWVITPVAGRGILLQIRPVGTDKTYAIGVAPQDAVRIARHLLATAHTLGANVNEGIIK